jgi:hypothetical protein
LSTFPSLSNALSPENTGKKFASSPSAISGQRFAVYGAERYFC